MITATRWYHRTKRRWNAALTGRPEVNATAGTPEELAEILAEAYTRVTGAPLDPAEITWSLTEPPIEATSREDGEPE